ncbi:MAG: TetR/AcrR family transcriptional regulator [Bifidobacteriaceae bacterium]|jgi:AcrR family transcriptional regulator|nr:TetR/AcrR family transcriptional regulator [Bifidobacteriaceae bacterium]
MATATPAPLMRGKQGFSEGDAFSSEPVRQAASKQSDSSSPTRGDVKRHQIIDAATDVFSQQGYRAASLREIAARVGTSHQGLAYHFASKEALLLAVLERRDQLDVEAFGIVRGQGLEALRGLIGLQAKNVRHRRIVELFTQLSAESTQEDHPAHQFFQERYQRVLGEVECAYQAAQTAGYLRPGTEPAAAAATLVAVMDGLQIQWLLGRLADPVAALRTHIAAQLTDSAEL